MRGNFKGGSIQVVGYPQPNKGRSRDLMRKFASGCGGRVQFDPPERLEDGPAAFYGVVGIEHLLNQARDEGRDYYYLDNSFFDKSRGGYMRVGVNAIQDLRPSKPNWERLSALNLEIRPWQRGRHIVVCQQSDHFMREVARCPEWKDKTLKILQENTDRPIVLRPWSSDKGVQGRTLREDLKDAWALVTHMSAAANEALLSGVPVFVTGECAASPMASGELSNIENPLYPDGREEWAAVLAGKQWTPVEIQNGTAWKAICDAAG